jgi:endonuclease/exonuclease/phosphatase family metal-dependent hydrolase
MTEAEAATRLSNYLAAEAAILSGAQEYTIGNGSTARKVRRADLEQIRAGIAEARIDLVAIQSANQPRRILYLRPGA